MNQVAIVRAAEKEGAGGATAPLPAPPFPGAKMFFPTLNPKT